MEPSTPPPNQPDLALLRERDRRLRAVAAELRQAFVGIDETIDQLVDAVRVWYVCPETLSRPVVVNLWGMTGVGKTDLVRRLVKGLGFQDRFLEIELGDADRTSQTVTSALRSNQLDDEQPKVLLFDEVQRFHTIDAQGRPVKNLGYRDFWELLSDGRLSRRNREDLDFLLAELLLNQRRRAGDDPKDPVVDLYDAKTLKDSLGLSEDLVDVASMDTERIVAAVRSAAQQKRMFEPVDHSRTLIVISGNLDDAFAMAGQSAEADVDADIFHAFTQKVTLVDVKQALGRRFQPEQVARFGNVHLIYRSLKREHFEQVIRREVERNVRTARETFGIELTVSPAIEALIYRNGVFPAQGVRPVLSSVADVLEANLARFALDGDGADGSRGALRPMHLDYDEAGAALVARLGDGPAARELRRPYVGRLDRARQEKTDDLLANVAVHEAGHAVAYAVLFGLAPLQLSARVASAFAAGFTFPHEVYETRDAMLLRVQVYLAGGLAEELVFGPGNASTGRLADRRSATGLALDFVRRHGFDERFQANYALDDAHAMDKDPTDRVVEGIVAAMAGKVRELLAGHRTLLLALANGLVRNGILRADQVAATCREHGLTVAVRPEGHLVVPGYRRMLDEGASAEH